MNSIDIVSCEKLIAATPHIHYLYGDDGSEFGEVRGAWHALSLVPEDVADLDDFIHVDEEVAAFVECAQEYFPKALADLTIANAEIERLRNQVHQMAGCADPFVNPTRLGHYPLCPFYNSAAAEFQGTTP